MDESTLQLFRQEIQELLQQVGQSLTIWIESPSLDQKQHLIRLVELIYKGALQMNIRALEPPTIRFLTLLQTEQEPEEAVIPQAQLQQITQVYSELRKVEIRPSDSPVNVRWEDKASSMVATTLPEAEPLANGAGEADRDEGADQAHDSQAHDSQAHDSMSMALNHVLLNQDFEALLLQLQQSLEQLSADDLVQDLQTQIEVWLGWGAVFNWPDISTIAEQVTEALVTSPSVAKSIGTLALVGLKALQREAQLRLEIKSPDHPDIPTVSLSQDNGASRRWASDVKPSPTEFPVTPYPTEKKFIWRTDSFLFTVPSDSVREILIPKREQIVTHGQKQQLKIGQQTLPILQVMDCLRSQPSFVATIQHLRGDANALSHPVLDDSQFVQQPFLVIQAPLGTIALGVEIQQCIREPILEIQQTESRFAFYLGDTHLPNQPEMAMIDVLALLNIHNTSNALYPKVPLPLPQTTSTSELRSRAGKHASDSARILIVDDSRTVRYFLKQTFQKAGYQILEAHNGLEAILELERNPQLRLMVSDVEMPNLNGFELLTHCRRNPVWAALPIIMLSQCDTTQHQSLALEFGANAYFTKPYDERQFLKTVGELLQV